MSNDSDVLIKVVIFEKTPRKYLGAKIAVLRSRLEAGMRVLSSVGVCICVLYVVDSIWFDGWYFSIVNQIINSAVSVNW